jgi:hypothetical protein
MKTIIKLIFIAIWFYALYINTHWHYPANTELETLSGRVTQIQEIPSARRKHRWHILVTIANDGVIRSLVGYDVRLLSRLKTGDAVTAGVFRQNGVSELWALQSDSGFALFASDMQQARKDAIGYMHYFFYVFGAVFLYATLFKKFDE